ncbi:MAG: electron transport complex subunit RsxG [Alphaproteobacteria bacterium]
MKRPTWVHALILGGFCLVYALLLAVTNMFTAEPIRQRAIEDTENSLNQVVPASLYENKLVADPIFVKGETGEEVKIYRGTKAGKVTGVAYEIRGSGYAGAIRLIMGVDPNGHILGVRAVSFKETPGLGDKIDAKKSDWITRFTGKFLGDPPKDKWKVKKDGGVFDQFSGATITPRAVVNAIRKGLEFFESHKAQILEVR